MHWFHGLLCASSLLSIIFISFAYDGLIHRPEDQKRVVAAIKEGRVPDADVSELLKPNTKAIPIDLTMSPNAKYTETKPWPPSKPGGKAGTSKGKSMFVERASSKRKLQEASSSREMDVFDAAPGPSSSSAIPSSSQTPAPASSAPRQPGEVANGRLVQEQDQEEEEEEEEAAVQEDDVFYLRYPTEVVGIQHYRGLVGVGEAVNLVCDVLVHFCDSSLTFA
jgi:SWI/SNF-related matrix-associated actin-dependent regulator of chromatin subfamily A3